MGKRLCELRRVNASHQSSPVASDRERGVVVGYERRNSLLMREIAAKLVTRGLPKASRQTFAQNAANNRRPTPGKLSQF